MTLYIDGDALPTLLKPTLLRTIERLQLDAVVISNKRISLGDSSKIRYLIVDQGADKADDLIVEMLHPEDLVITSDIPLADRVLNAGAHAINHRGTRYTPENIKELLATRNLMERIRESGEITPGPKPFSPKDLHAFANQLNAFFQEMQRRSSKPPRKSDSVL